VLAELRIAGLGVIDTAAVDLGPGLTAVTGETGAGKTMFVSALLLAGGGRADAGRVRSGARRATVEVRYSDVPSQVGQLIADAGGEPDEDGSVIAVRTVAADGRSRAILGGVGVPLSVLADAAGSLITIHGQAEAMTLLRPAQQRAVLDRFAGCADDLTAYREVRSRWQAAGAELDRRLNDSRERAQREQLLQLGLAEIAGVAPQPGEDEAIAAEVRRLDNVDALRNAAATAVTALAGNDDDPDAPTAVGLAEAARRSLTTAADPALQEVASRIREAQLNLGDASAELAAYLSKLDADPDRLERLMLRQAALRTLTRKYGADADGVLAWADAARAELETLDSSTEVIERLRAQVAAAAEELVAAGSRLTARRTEAAGRLSERANRELGGLHMGRASLRINVEPTPPAAGDTTVGSDHRPGPDGFDTVSILLRSHSGAPELSVQRGASGGELSRVMLALEVVLADADPVPTLVFDEVDAGVGGRAATEIGALLARLASTHQVLVVTHLAQVAAFADDHLVVTPTELSPADPPTGPLADSEVAEAATGPATDGQPPTRVAVVRRVEGDDRVGELARMLGGTETESARRHAEDLLAQAAQRRAAV
jgi:DNA repair protein RecN (Recombination protein N)